VLLIVVTYLAGICVLPFAVFSTLWAFTGHGDSAPALVVGMPLLVAYPVALWLALRSRRPYSTGRAWLIAAIGLLLIIGTAALPVTVVGLAVHEEWQETQPGGRGYRPSP